MESVHRDFVRLAFAEDRSASLKSDRKSGEAGRREKSVTSAELEYLFTLAYVSYVSTLQSRRSRRDRSNSSTIPAPFRINSTTQFAGICVRTLTGVLFDEFKFVRRVSRTGKQTANVNITESPCILG